MEKTIETEVKLACDDPERLRRSGFDLQLTTPRHFEDNWLLDSSDYVLLQAGSALRVRVTPSGSRVTYKGMVEQSAISVVKTREELETDVADPVRMIEVFEKLGYFRAFRYQKYRTIFSLTVDGTELEVVFDETPLGNFVEIEGDEQAILQVVRAAGFSPDEMILESYPELQTARCKGLGIPLEDLVF